VVLAWGFGLVYVWKGYMVVLCCVLSE